MALLSCLLLSVPEESSLPSAFPVDLTAETLRVGASGTETLQRDQARVFPGKGALLEREVTLSGKASRGRPVTEKLWIRAELRVADATEKTLVLRLDSRVRVLAVSEGGALPRDEVRRSASLEIAHGASQLVTLYESPSTGERVVLNLAWSLPDESSSEGVDPVPVELAVRIFEIAEAGESLLASNRLLAVVGHAAETNFDRVVPLSKEGEEKRARQDRLQISLIPRFLSGRNLSVALEVGGSLETLTPDNSTPHPLAHRGNYLLSQGVPVSPELTVSSDSPEKEGWTQVRFRIEVQAFF